jgi:hypothetical protein
MPSDEAIQRVLNEAKAESLAVRSAIGIPPELRPRRTLYNAAGGAVVALVEHRSSNVFERRLFFRRTSERAYRLVGSPPPEIHFDDVVTSTAHPNIYYTVRRITKLERSGEFGADWESVDRFDLERETADTVIARGQMKLPQPYAYGWVSTLFGAATDDSVIYCSCGFQGSEKRKVHYWLCSVTPYTQVVTLISRLEAVWF